MQKRITSLLLLMLGKSLWDSIVFAQKCSKEYMKISSSTFYCPGKKKKTKPRTLGANYSAVLDFDLSKSPSGFNLTTTEER